MKRVVSVTKCNSYNEEKVSEAVNKCVNLLGGWSKFIKRGDKVLVKPNLLSEKPPSKAVTTHPIIVKTVLKQVIRLKATPVIADSPPLQNAVFIAKKCGIKNVCDELGVEIRTLTNPIKVRKRSKDFIISADLKNFNKVINLPKLKTHSLALMTGAVKNVFGCVPGKIKSEVHAKLPSAYDISKYFYELLMIIKPVLNITDAIVGMEGEGPGSGTPVKLGYVTASSDALALDFINAKLMGFKPRDVPLINYAIKELSYSYESIEVRGDELIPKNVKKPVANPLIGLLTRYMRNFFISKPSVLKDKCAGCAGCARVCPVHAITMRGGKPVFDYKKCIACYCCQEVCPAHAIKINKNFIARLFGV